MKPKIIKYISLSILILSILGNVIFQMYLIAKFPDVTQARLLITYWKQYLLFIIVYALSYSSYRYCEKKEINKLINDLRIKSREELI